MEIALSIVVATYNRSHLLKDTLATLVAQVVPADVKWEIGGFLRRQPEGFHRPLEWLTLFGRLSGYRKMRRPS